MKAPWTNIVLLLLLLVQLVTGYYGMVNGREPRAWILWLHGIGAYGLLLLFYWKGTIILDALRRKHVWTRDRQLFWLTLALLLTVLTLGFAWSYAGPIYFLGFSLLSIHIYLAIPLMALMLYHAWRMRFILRLPATLSRRTFGATAVASLLGVLLWCGAERLKTGLALPGAVRRFTGSFETGSFTGRFPAVSWIADRPAPIDRGAWQLIVGGAVAQPLRFSYAEIEAMVTETVMATLDCTGGWYTAQAWTGVPLARLLGMAGVSAEAASVTVTAVSGYQRRFTLAEAEGYLLATAVADQPLSHRHGAPLRLVAPDQRGVNWVKWITRIRVNETGKWLQLPLPLQ